MKIRKIFSALLTAAVIAVTLSGCGGDGDNVTDSDMGGEGNGQQSQGQSYTLTVWGAEEDQQMLKEMCQAYADANPSNTYKFNFGVQGENDVADKVLNDAQNGPDVYSFASDQINKLYAGGCLARVGGTALDEIKNANSEGSIDACTVTVGGEDQVYAYPSTGDNCCFVYYDKRVFTDEKMLSSLDTMLDAAEDAGKKVHFKLNDDGWYLSTFFFAEPDLKYSVTYNENMVETKVDINFGNDDGLEIMKSLNKYIGRDGLVAQTEDSKIIAAFTPDSSGKTEAAAAVTGTWNSSAVREILGENMGVCKLPTVQVAGEQLQLSGFMGYKLMGVNGFSKNKGEAHKLAQWLTNEQNQLTRYEKRGFGPTNKNVAASEKVQNDAVMKAVFAQAEYNRTQKSVPSTYWTPMASLVTPIINAKAQGKTLTDKELKEQLTAAVDQIKK